MLVLGLVCGCLPPCVCRHVLQLLQVHGVTQEATHLTNHHREALTVTIMTEARVLWARRGRRGGQRHRAWVCSGVLTCHRRQ